MAGGRGTEHSAKHISFFQQIAQHHRRRFSARFQSDDLLGALVDRVAQLCQAFPQLPREVMQAGALVVAAFDHIQRGGECGDLFF